MWQDNLFLVSTPFYLFIYFLFYFIFKLYIIVLVLPNIWMNPPQVYIYSLLEFAAAPAAKSLQSCPTSSIFKDF